jgi:hypothetical protein
MRNTHAATNKGTSEAAIFARVWETANGELSVDLARRIVRVGFSEEDKARMHELAEKNSAGDITPAELEEFDNFVKVAGLLAILHSKARKALKKRSGKKSLHG